MLNLSVAKASDQDRSRWPAHLQPEVLQRNREELEVQQRQLEDRQRIYQQKLLSAQKKGADTVNVADEPKFVAFRQRLEDEQSSLEAGQRVYERDMMSVQKLKNEAASADASDGAALFLTAQRELMQQYQQQQQQQQMLQQQQYQQQMYQQQQQRLQQYQQQQMDTCEQSMTPQQQQMYRQQKHRLLQQQQQQLLQQQQYHQQMYQKQRMQQLAEYEQQQHEVSAENKEAQEVKESQVAEVHSVSSSEDSFEKLDVEKESNEDSCREDDDEEKTVQSELESADADLLRDVEAEDEDSETAKKIKAATWDFPVHPTDTPQFFKPEAMKRPEVFWWGDILKQEQECCMGLADKHKKLEEEGVLAEEADRNKPSQAELTAKYLAKCQNDWKIDGEQQKEMMRKEKQESAKTPSILASLAKRKAELLDEKQLSDDDARIKGMLGSLFNLDSEEKDKIQTSVLYNVFGPSLDAVISSISAAQLFQASTNMKAAEDKQTTAARTREDLIEILNAPIGHLPMLSDEDGIAIEQIVKEWEQKRKDEEEQQVLASDPSDTEYLATGETEREQLEEEKKSDNNKIPVWAETDEKVFQENLFRMQSNRAQSLQSIKNLMSKQRECTSLEELKEVSEKIIIHSQMIADSTNNMLDSNVSAEMKLASARVAYTGSAPQSVVTNQYNNMWSHLPLQYQPLEFHFRPRPNLSSGALPNMFGTGPNQMFGAIPNQYLPYVKPALPEHNPVLTRFVGNWRLAAGSESVTEDDVVEKRITHFSLGNSIEIGSFVRRRAPEIIDKYSELERWINEHKENPYPTKGDKIMLAMKSMLTLEEVSRWMSSAIQEYQLGIFAPAPQEQLVQIDNTSWSIDYTLHRDSLSLGGVAFSTQGGFVRCEMAVKEEKLLIRRFDEKKKTIVTDTYVRV